MKKPHIRTRENLINQKQLEKGRYISVDIKESSEDISWKINERFELLFRAYFRTDLFFQDGFNKESTTIISYRRILCKKSSKPITAKRTISKAIPHKREKGTLRGIRF